MFDGTRPPDHEAEHGPGRVCECGHTATAHMGEGTCLAVHSKDGKAAGSVKMGSICPCLTWRPA